MGIDCQRRKFAAMLALSGFVCAETVCADALDNLVPVPKCVRRSDGVASAAVLSHVRVEEGTVAGAPERTKAESYRLVVSPDGVMIAAGDPRGVRYARVTLDQLVKLSDGRVPCCTIEDWPDYPWRGLMHDCGRNFLSMKNVRKVLDLMAAYKMNLFHWHITDYYGWRLESKKYPTLQAPWAFRRQNGRFYSQSDFRGIVDYAKARGITVMPEIDLPGHSLAFRRGIGVTYMSEAKVKGVVCELIDELCTLASAEEMPFVHLGTDEARTPYEQVPDSFCPAWAERVWANGRTPVGWRPGKNLTTEDGKRAVGMIWSRKIRPAADDVLFDTHQCYFGGMDPLTFLNVALSANPCKWANVPDANKLGIVACSWHDDYLGEGDTSRVFLDCNFAPAAVTYSELAWTARTDGNGAYANRLPKPGTPDYARAAKLEDRFVAHRDKVAPSFGLPFNFVRQLNLRWRISDGADGSVVAKDVAQGAIMLAKCGLGDLVPEQSYLQKTKGVAILETWIRSPKEQMIGAWIGFMRFDRSGGRGMGTPEAGEWGVAAGTTVEVNGMRIPAPEWTNPGLKFVMANPDEPSSNNIAETPFTDEEYFMRRPTPVRLMAGWNHVKLTVPKVREHIWLYDWTATFVPVTCEGTPREVPGLEFSSDPK